MARCKSCGAEIRWVMTAGGKHMPVDAKPEKRMVRTGEDVYSVVDAYVPHFVTCPDAASWRK